MDAGFGLPAVFRDKERFVSSRSAKRSRSMSAAISTFGSTCGLRELPSLGVQSFPSQLRLPEHKAQDPPEFSLRALKIF